MVNLVATSLDELRLRSDFPHQIHVNPDVKIPLSDGNWLHARLWMPTDSIHNPVPALVEYAPFRHRDFTAPRDALIHPWFAGHGYASLRVELRGSGDSSGLAQDEYISQEQDDALEALEWIAAQNWCNGSTGMFGMSWGAFSALQVAARQPPSLRAIIPVHGTDDRFSDDIHYKGGCLLTAGLSWGSLYTLYAMRPPDPALSGENWRQRWLERIVAAPIFLEEWLTHQFKNDYWQHGSISENYSQLTCPTLVVCGWADGYTNAAMRMAEHLPENAQVIIGPWAHTYPHLARPGPQIDFLQEAVKWWDKWLKGQDNGVDHQSRLRIWLQDSAPPATSYDLREGRWIAFEEWPYSYVTTKNWNLQPGKLSNNKPIETVLSIQSPLANAINGPEWLPHGVGPELPDDQQAEDEGSLCFDTDILRSVLIICGAPTLRLRLKSNTETGIVHVRLIDLFEDGQAAQISYGLLNLQHRNGMDLPQKMKPDEWVDVEIALNPIAQSVPAGHRLRVSISTQAWPLAWPAAENLMLQLVAGQSRLSVPLLRPEDLESLETAPLEVAAIPRPLDIRWIKPVKRERNIEIDSENNTVSRSYLKDDGAFCIEEHDLEVRASGSLTYRSQGEDPLTVQAEYQYQIHLIREDWDVQVECELQVTSDSQYFYIKGTYIAIEKGQICKQRKYNRQVRRKYV